MPGEFPMVSGQTIQDINSSVSTYRSFQPGRFPAQLATTDPRDVIASVDEIDRCVEEFGVAGLVWHHHFFGAFINDPAMFQIVAHAERHRLPIFVHIIDGSFLESPWRLEQLADAFPEMTFVALDGFSSPDRAQWMVYLAEKHPNILFDTGVATSVSHMLPRFIDSIGADRLIFGSDFYSEPRFFDVPFVLYELLNSEVGEAALAQVLGGNARRLLEIEP
jgi:predicted TIM-barrel fold metal-dependent hydrolase